MSGIRFTDEFKRDAVAQVVDLGTNKNTNRLLRQYFPKKTNLAVHSQDDLNSVANHLNTRPRKTLGFKNPAYKLAEMLR